MPSVEQKVIEEAISRCEIRLAEINVILEATPLSDVIAARKEASALLEKYKGKDRLSDEFAEQMSVLAKKEADAFAMYEKQREANALIDESVRLTLELDSLKSRLYFCKRNSPSPHA